MKNLQFSKDDILSALLDITRDSMARGELTRSLIDAKIKRLVSKKKFETRSMDKKFGTISEMNVGWDKFSSADKSTINKKIKSLNLIINQIDKLTDYRNELSRSSFSSETLEKLESNVEKSFKWERPLTYDDIFTRGD